jgi:hypothetical protein
MSQQSFQTGGWYPNLDGLKLPLPLVRGVEQAFRLIYSLRDVLNNLVAQVGNRVDVLAENAVLGKANLTNPNVVTKVGAAGEIVEGGITDESAGASNRVRITAAGNVGISNPMNNPPAVDPAVHLIVGGNSVATVGEFTAASIAPANSLVGTTNFANYALLAAEKRVAFMAGFTDGAINTGRFGFYTMIAGVVSERVRITAAGQEVTGDVNITGVYRKNGIVGFTGTVPLARLNTGGIQGSMTVSGGIITAVVPPT